MPRTARLLRSFSGLLLGLHLRALRYPRITLGLMAALLLASVPGLLSLKTALSVSDLAESRITSLDSLRRFRKDFGEGLSALVVFSVPGKAPGALGEDRLDSRELCRIRDWIARQPAENRELTDIRSPFELRRAVRSRGRLWYPRVLPDPCAPGAPRQQALFWKTLGQSPWNGLLSSASGRELAAEFVFRDAPGHPFEPGAARRLMRDAEQAFGGSRVRLSFVGSAPYQAHFETGLERTRLLNLLIVALICGIFRLLFGGFRAGLLFLATLGFTAVVLYGGMGFAGDPVDVLTTGLFLLVSIATLEDFVFLSYLRMTSELAWRACFRRLLVPSFFTSLTTVIGFGSLCASDLAIIRRFGFWAAFGSAFEWFAIFLVLPAVLELVPRLRQWTRLAGARGLALSARAARFPAGPRVRLAAAALFAGSLALLFGGQIRFGDDLLGFFPWGHPQQRSIRDVQAALGWTTVASVVFEPPVSEGQAEIALERLRSLPGVVSVENPFAIRRWIAGDVTGLTRALVYRELDSSPVSQRYFAGGGRVRANVFLEFSDSARLRSFGQQVERLCGWVHPCGLQGDLATYADFNEQVPRTLLVSLALSLLFVGAVLAFLASSLRYRYFAVLASSLWGPVVSLGVLVATGTRVNFLTSVFASALVGLTGDNAIQYMFASQRRPLQRGIDRLGGASFQVGGTMALGALVFVFSAFYPPRVFGALMATGLLISLAGDLWLLRALLRRRTPRSGA
jgi:uncharacterized protein